MSKFKLFVDFFTFSWMKKKRADSLCRQFFKEIQRAREKLNCITSTACFGRFGVPDGYFNIFRWENLLACSNTMKLQNVVDLMYNYFLSFFSPKKRRRGLINKGPNAKCFHSSTSVQLSETFAIIIGGQSTFLNKHIWVS